MIIQNKLKEPIKFKIENDKYIHLDSMQECNLCLKNSAKSLELVNTSFATKRKTVITILLFPILLIVYLIASLIGVETFEYSFYYDLSCTEEDDVLKVEYDDKKNVILKCGNKIIENYGHSKIKSFIVFMLLSAYTILIYFCIACVIYEICK